MMLNNYEMENGLNRKFQTTEQHDLMFPLSSISQFCYEIFTQPLSSFRSISSLIGFSNRAAIVTAKNILLSVHDIDTDADETQQYFLAKEFTVNNQRHVFLRIIIMNNDCREECINDIIPICGIIYHVNLTTLNKDSKISVTDISFNIYDFINNSFVLAHTSCHKHDVKLHLTNKETTMDNLNVYYNLYTYFRILKYFDIDPIKDDHIPMSIEEAHVRLIQNYISKYSAEELLDECGILYIIEGYRKM